MKSTYEAALIVRRAAALQKRYVGPGLRLYNATKPGYAVALAWIKRAITRLRKIGMWSEAEDLNRAWSLWEERA